MQPSPWFVSSTIQNLWSQISRTRFFACVDEGPHCDAFLDLADFERSFLQPPRLSSDPPQISSFSIAVSYLALWKSKHSKISDPESERGRSKAEEVSTVLPQCCYWIEHNRIGVWHPSIRYIPWQTLQHLELAISDWVAGLIFHPRWWSQCRDKHTSQKLANDQCTIHNHGSWQHVEYRHGLDLGPCGNAFGDCENG